MNFRLKKRSYDGIVEVYLELFSRSYRLGNLTPHLGPEQGIVEILAWKDQVTFLELKEKASSEEISASLQAFEKAKEKLAQKLLGKSKAEYLDWVYTAQFSEALE